MSPEILRFFAQLLDQVQVPASAPDFEETTALIIRVRRELREALNAAKSDEPAAT